MVELTISHFFQTRKKMRFILTRQVHEYIFILCMIMNFFLLVQGLESGFSKGIKLIELTYIMIYQSGLQSSGLVVPAMPLLIHKGKEPSNYLTNETDISSVLI